MFLHDRIDPNDRFRERRRQALRRRRIRRAIVVLLVAGIVAAIAGGATYFTSRGSHSAAAPRPETTVRPKAATSAFRTQAPTEIRGVHVTEGLASLPGKLDEYLGLTKQGLNTIELDVKDENGYVGFISAD